MDTSARGQLRVAVLGPLEVRREDELLVVGGARLRALLTRLVLDSGRPVSTPALIDALWGQAPPADVVNALQSLVSRLRRALGDPSTVSQSAAGYDLGPAIEVDLRDFEVARTAARGALQRGDFDLAAGRFAEALALWRGEPLADAGDAPYAEAARVRLVDQHLDTLADHAEAALALSRYAEMCSPLAALVAEHPLRERFTAQLMTALAGAGRPAEALAAFDRLRQVLADELGTDPSPALREQHLRLLRGDVPVAPKVAAPQPVLSRRGNLRSPLTSFVGREDEIARVLDLLDAHRLVTVVGTGGAGKTRLSGEVARRLSSCDTWLVELASVTDPLTLPIVILDTLGIREMTGRNPTERTVHDAITRLQEMFSNRDTLLVLDNCEHLVDAAAALVEELLERCPALRILATSREPLAIAGEFLHDLASLPQPPSEASPAEAMTYPAVALFVDRARASRPDFDLTDENVADITEIVRRLDGLPLAIELAAARLRTLPIAAVAAGLSDRFRLLTGGSRTALPRHRTLRAVVAWSWELLTPPERLLAERLAIFPAGATTAAAQEVCSDEGLLAGDLTELMSSLVDRSLLVVSGDGELRYRMLETIREYGIERLAERGELAVARERHASYFCELVISAQEHFHDHEQLDWFMRVDVERDNALAALSQLCANREAQRATDMVIALAWLWMIKGNHHEVGPLVGSVLAVEGEVDPLDRALAEAIYGLHMMMAGNEQGTPEQAEAAMADAVVMSERLDDVDIRKHPLLAMMRPVLAWLTGRTGEVNRLVEEAEELDDPWVAAMVLMTRANIAENDGDIEQMGKDAHVAVEAFRGMGDRWGTSGALRVRARLETLRGNLDAAVRDYEEALHLSENLDEGDHLEVRIRLAEVYARLGNLDAARGQVDRIAVLAARNNRAEERGWAKVTQGELFLSVGDLASARTSLSAAMTVLRPLENGPPRGKHILAWTQSALARLGAAEGNLIEARADIAAGWPNARGTEDMPIVASVAVSLSQILEKEGRYAEAAEVLGGAAVIRGTDDPTDLQVRAVAAALRAHLGDGEFEERYATGRRLSRGDALQLGDELAR
jgi:predicted ATPase/DNA-binding SARP family transcriptional activator